MILIEKFAIVDPTGTMPHGSNKYSEIVENLNKMGMQETNLNNCEGVIFINYDKKSYKKYLKNGRNYKHSILIRLEPVAVFPSQYRKNIESKFGLIIDPGKPVKHTNNFNFIGWPYKYHLNPSKPDINDPHLENRLDELKKSEIFKLSNWERRLHKMVMIAGNKVSPTSNANYRLRRKLARQLKPAEIDLFGDMWQFNLITRIHHRVAIGLNSIKNGFFPNVLELYGGLFTNYLTALGVIENKHALLQKYKFALVVENSSEYCSEKLFDALINGTIPVYVGPQNSDVNLPDNLFYWTKGSVLEIKNFINRISMEEISFRLKCIESFISSSSFKLNWDSKEVYKKISVQIYDYWRKL